MTPNNDATHKSADVQALGHSPDAREQRQQQLLDLLRQTAPEVLSDNQIDVERLKALLGEERLAPAEHYELSWAGKKDARREIQKKTSHTLKPDADNPESAHHMLIEGENLEVLRVLQKSYYGKVKMIYIDPPYNTGNDSFVYPDDYSETLDEYQKRTGEKNEAGFLNKQSLWKKNSKESGQYHSAWLSMMYPRLYLARNLLREDGVIFISIDDNEAANLKLLCDEVFGEENFVAQLSILCNPKGRSQDKHFATNHEYSFVYSKSPLPKGSMSVKKEKDQIEAEYPEEDEGGKYRLLELRNTHREFGKHNRKNMYFPIYVDKHGKVSLDSKGSVTEVLPIWDDGFEGCWTWGPDKANDEIEKLVGKIVSGNWKIFRKSYANGAERMLKTILSDKKYFTEKGQKYFNLLLKAKGKEVFQSPKSPSLIFDLMKTCTSADEIVMDFFAGSGTTAHAVMELNAEDGGSRQSISVQLPEKLEDNSEAYKAGYRTIADITRARIEKVIAKLKADHPEKTAELACANFTLAPSNFKVWNSELNDPGAIRQQLDALQNTEKHADEQTAMLTELLLKNGLGALGVHAVSKPRKLRQRRDRAPRATRRRPLPVAVL
ncbi:site-specific DNA-methyltransferase [Halomonas llamarensis]|uniref:site-specific DNA-methyltransferase (adenine-specific) n=1 Tax=Halomonas llamarensis TaxID=2945104 RepID=A0ABT0SKR6_9GAMM|nr:site-specific DNA-methyltransferase [Halomonas llamarensis]MCL7928405.1 site-specific DNA-methyltransferase [Halomonas llamarensis]